MSGGRQVGPHTREWVLGPDTEYRFELDPGTSLAIKLVRGRAEVFGAELVEGKTLLFAYEAKAAVFTWHGCTLEVTGAPSTEYVADETPMAAYANVHVALEKMRVRAQEPEPASDDNEPPRVLVLGPENSGKTTVCKILANYAVRAGQGWEPLYINVDPSEGGWTVPGTISAASITVPIPTASPATPLGNAATSSASTLAANALTPLVYWYGHADTKRNPLLLERLIRNLGENVGERQDNDPEGRLAGIIIDTPSSFASSTTSGADHRLTLIRACVDAFRINVILVVGHEKLNVEMQRTYGNRMSVVKIPKSGGVVELDSSYRHRVQTAQIHNYMYGQAFSPPQGLGPLVQATPGGEAALEQRLAPSSQVVSVEDLVIYRIGEESMAPTSALPIGATRTVSELVPVRLDPTQPGARLHSALLALMHQSAEDAERYDEELLDMQVAGFLALTGVDAKARKMTVLAPTPIPFGGGPARVAIVGSFEWTEQS
ncbi:Clp1-domain-containing protein [Vararia minispora EC-137]|uniref:Clp1-domain-containing protein n=1 Tax=Vararia minispora EC-137 TaxID=1314806 RepID=A0ACB8QIT0_9AGAM|nr:Clp1-domain-containing protein [Vararia minispora EC-137]